MEKDVLGDKEMEKQLHLLDESIEHYQARLLELKNQFNKASFLSLLLHRDQIAKLLQQEPTTPAIIHKLTDLDKRLCSKVFGSKVSKRDWEAWRKTLNPDSSLWWWYLDERSSESRNKQDLLWIVLAGLVTTVSIGLLVEIIDRLWGSGPDWLSTVITAFSVLLTGSALTKYGPEAVKQLLGKVPRLAPHHHGEAMFAMALVGLIGILCIRFFALPSLALYYNNRGVAYLEAGALTKSLQDIQRAVALNPDHTEAYYNLAEAYTDIGNYDQGQELYTQALVADPTLDLAYNGLGYVLLLQGQAKRAIPILYAGLDLAQDKDTQLSLWTNLGRAYLETNSFKEAERALVKALEINPREAAANCYMAATADLLEYPESRIKSFWEDCLRYANPTTAQGQELISRAKVHLIPLDEH